MKQLYTIVISLLALTSYAQNINPDFEEWIVKSNSFNVNGTFMGVAFSITEPAFNYNEVKNWSSTNQLTQAVSFSQQELVTASLNSFSGDTAVRLQSNSLTITVQTAFGPFDLDNVAPALLISGDITIDVQDLVNSIANGGNLNALNPFTFPETGHPIDFRPKTLYGNYQYTGVNNDSCLIVAGAIKNRELIAVSINRLGNTPANTYVPFALDFDYINCELPDTIVTLICASNLDLNLNAIGEFEINSNYTGENGSLLLIDNLSMDTLDLGSFPPIAVNDFDTILNIEIATSDVIVNDEFCDGSMPIPTVIDSPTNGSVAVNVNGELVYTPDAGFVGQETITYEVCNSGMLCDTAVWTIEVSAVEPCVADDITITILINTVELVTVSNANCGGTPTIIGSPSNGAADVEVNDQISYSPNTDFTGLDTIQYVICNVNDTNQCDTGFIFINVIVTGINELDANSFSVYPNPVSNELNVRINDTEITLVEVFNITGKRLIAQGIEEHIAISTQNLTNGLYFVRLSNSKGSSSVKIEVSK